MTSPSAPAGPGTVRREAWRAVVGFGLVSLAADMVYEGARSVYGPLLAALGAGALVVGLVTGAGEAMALVLRLVSGSLADRTGRYWTITLAGYGMTAVCVPLLAVTPLLGAAGLAVAISLILAERAGKAVRSPAKTALLAEVATRLGGGRGFGVHKALDEVGAFAGPLLVAAIVAAVGAMWPALAVLALPGAIAMALLLGLRARSTAGGSTPDVASADAAPGNAAPGDAQVGSWWADVTGAGLGRRFGAFAACAAAATAGLVTFGVIGYHLVTAGVVPLAAVPVVYAAGQAASAVAALATGFAYDRVGARVLIVLPLLVAAVPVFAFSRAVGMAVAGVACWGAANGLQDSTVKAVVADLVPSARRATAYGVFAAIQGAAALLGGAVAGWLYDRSIPALIAVVAVSQLGTLALLWATLRRRPPAGPAGG